MSAPRQKYESANGLLDSDGYFRVGKFTGTHLTQVTVEYLEQLLSANRCAVRVLQGEIDRRSAEQAATNATTERLIDLGFRALAQEAHPDRGGDGARMRDVLMSRDALRTLIRGGR